jgi:hypothetical protein
MSHLLVIKLFYVYQLHRRSTILNFKIAIRLLFCGTTAQIGPKISPFLRFIDHTQLDRNTLGTAPLKQWSFCRRRRYLHDTQQTKETNIQALSEILTRDPSNQVAADYALDSTATGISNRGIQYLAITVQKSSSYNATTMQQHYA